MRNSKRLTVAGVACILVVVFAVSALRGQGDVNDAKTKTIRIVTAVKRTGIASFERMEEESKSLPRRMGLTPP